MAKFTTSRALNMLWRGRSIVAAAGETVRIPDPLYDDFIEDFVTDTDGTAMPDLSWVEDDEVEAASQGEASHPGLATHISLGLSSSIHTHPQSSVTGLTTDLSAKADSAHDHDADYEALGHNHDGTYSISAHSHTDGGEHPDLAGHISLGLETSGHDHDGSYSATVHTHAESQVTGLVSDLAGKSDTSHDHDADYAATVHTHAQSSITNLTTDLDGKAASIHTHAQSAITNLTSDLGGKAATVHQHATSDISNFVISRGGTVEKSDGVTTGWRIVWRAPYDCTVTNVRGYRVGGTGATVNARKNGASNHLASDLSLTSADTWMDGGSVQNTAYAAGDKMEIGVQSAAGTPTQIAVQIDLTRP
jgi:hypothetical protein